MLLELFPFVTLNNAMAFIYAYFFSVFLRFDMSLLLLTVSCGGYLISIAYCHFLAHLSRRLTGELIVYPWSGVRRRPSVVRPSVVRRPSFTMLKHLLLRNRLADQSQILCGASLGRGNEILFAASGSHDQDGRHAHIW